MSDSELLSKDKIESICRNVPDIEPMEQLRLKVKKRTKTFILTSIIIAAVLISALILLKPDSRAPGLAVASVFALILGLLIFYFVAVSPVLSKLKTKFKENIIKYYISSILPGSHYEPEKYHNLSEYYESLLFMIDVDRHSGENYVKGVFDKTELSFSFMHTEYKQVEHTKNGQKVTWHTIFKGVFLCADSNKNFKGKTIILPDTAEKYLGGFGKWLQRHSGNTVGELVYMENVKFEKEFVVYSTDPVEARYLITPKIQEQIFHIKNLLKKDLRLSFVNNRVFIAISRDDIFKLNTSLSFKNPETLRYYMKDIIELLTLIHLLDLNIRIWGR
ncbi:MAG: DUF3137 domain-containing protein [Prevotellaceae bacterium]|jgi:hypothetical protein|nr:DUF3137 domain-containing protein [Prevotellaceae bacterium]